MKKLLLVLPALVVGFAISAAPPIPVILDTDIGDDIDDTWALCLALQSPELDLKLVVGDYGRPEYRARLIAKILAETGHETIPVGVGMEVPGVGGKFSQLAWLGDYQLTNYPGKVYTNGVQAIIDVVMKSPTPVTLLCIGPVPNIAAALEREPQIARRARFVGMHGSVYRGYNGSTNVHAEWNVKAAPKALQKAFSASWPITITPLDTCGTVVLNGPNYARIRDSKARGPVAIMGNYRAWAANREGVNPNLPDEMSSTLFDCVAVYLAIDTALCEMETVPLQVTDAGFTKVDPQGTKVSAAVRWKKPEAFYDWMTARLDR